MVKEGETLPDGLEHTGGGTDRVSWGLFYLWVDITIFRRLSIAKAEITDYLFVN